MIVGVVMALLTGLPLGLALFPVLADVPVPWGAWLALAAIGSIVVMLTRQARD